ncbi:hypothetical protein R9C00_04130 [Flammeovirgaceae bacterium SG7u.111]|nr:hypothetical protein [Flammeovirgaceae bacterium SG7u.132]WPO36635.1 hypothetical protein R9C00_04130 [Flammeovirgaceae bacterium SG7u.111]
MNEELKAQKETLKKEAEQYRNNIKAQINGTVDNVENAGKNALIAGGILLVGYGLFNLLSGKRQRTEYITQATPPTSSTASSSEQAPVKQVYVKPKRTSYFGKLLKEQLVMMVVDVARKSIKDILTPTEPTSPKTKKED